MRVESIAPQRLSLGESPWWDVEQEFIYWVDSFEGVVLRCRADGRELSQWTLDAVIGSLVLTTDNLALLATDKGLYTLDPGSGRFERVCDLEASAPNVRLNDGKADGHGRMVVGSMSLDDTPSATLYSIEPDLGHTILETAIVCTNGPCWSPDRRYLYVTDSLGDGRGTYRYDYDAATGAVSGRCLFAPSDPRENVLSDGATVDSDGGLWTAQHNAGALARYSPDGQLERSVELPMATVTSMSFGGPDLDILFVTSSEQVLLMPETGLSPGRYAGELVAVTGLGVTGLPEPRFGA